MQGGARRIGKIYLIPLFGFGSTRNANGTDAGVESAKLAALYLLVKGKQCKTDNFTGNFIRNTLPVSYNIGFTNYEKGQMNM